MSIIWCILQLNKYYHYSLYTTISGDLLMCFTYVSCDINQLFQAVQRERHSIEVIVIRQRRSRRSDSDSTRLFATRLLQAQDTTSQPWPTEPRLECGPQLILSLYFSFHYQLMITYHRHQPSDSHSPVDNELTIRSTLYTLNVLI